MKRVTPDIGDAFGPTVQALREAFITALFQGLGEGTPGRVITCLPVKQAGLELHDPTRMSPENCTASCVTTGHLVPALRGQEEFRTADHSVCLQEGKTAVRKRSVLLAEEALAETLEGAPVKGAR